MIQIMNNRVTPGLIKILIMLYIYSGLKISRGAQASLVAQWSRICLECRRRRRPGLDPWVGKIPCRRAWQPTPVFLPGESHEQRSLAGYSPQGSTGLDMTEVTQHAPMHKQVHENFCFFFGFYFCLSLFIPLKNLQVYSHRK